MGAIQKLPQDLAEWHLELRGTSFNLGVAGWTAWTEGDGPEPGLRLYARSGEILLRGERQRVEFGRVLDAVLANLYVVAENAVDDESVWTVAKADDEVVITGPVFVYGPDRELLNPEA